MWIDNEKGYIVKGNKIARIDTLVRQIEDIAQRIRENNAEPQEITEAIEKTRIAKYIASEIAEIESKPAWALGWKKTKIKLEKMSKYLDIMEQVTDEKNKIQDHEKQEDEFYKRARKPWRS